MTVDMNYPTSLVGSVRTETRRCRKAQVHRPKVKRVFSSFFSNRCPERRSNHAGDLPAAAREPNETRPNETRPLETRPIRFGDCQRGVSESLRFLLSGFADLCYPPTCVLCHGPLRLEGGAGGPDSLCGDCWATLRATAVDSACDRCCRPQPPVSAQIDQPPLCPACGQRSGAVQRSVALGMYRDVMREAVVAAKRLSFQPLALALGELLGERVRRRWQAVPIGAVTFVPSHWTRRCGRGGCPAELLARQVGRAIEAPVLPLLRSSRRTAKQGTLGDAERRTNVCGAFRAKKGYALLAPRVLLVDDVWTTGATLEEAAKAIGQGYDAEVFAAVIARAIGSHDG